MPVPFRSTTPRIAPALLALAVALPGGGARAQPEALTLSTVQVIGTAPLPGLGTPLQDVPANVQVHDGRDLQQQGPTSLSDFLEHNATSVTLNAAQGNAFQPDLSFRGFTASPLLGLPQGLSVFQDGVRINEPFGDVVNWDLLPPSAIASLQLLPGSHPGFGLNTLGGALSLHTKSGLTHPGSAFEAHGGSFQRRALEFETGGHDDQWNYFLTGHALDEQGWAEHNPSQLRQFFGKIGRNSAEGALDLSVTLADNTLQGTQVLPLSMAGNFRQAYTYPDINRNQLTFLNLKGSHSLGEALFLDANLYLRRYRNLNTSSNVNGDYDGAANLVQANNVRSDIAQDGYGAGVQLTHLGELAGRRNQLQGGLSADLGLARFTQESQNASFTGDRATVGSGNFSLSTQAGTDNRYYGVYLHDTLTLNDRWALSFSGRYNLATVRIRDDSGSAPGLNGDHTFTRFNPALGATFNPSSTLTAYAAYNEGMRVPTPIELTCADPAAPCRLPNNFLSDPPLRMVVARTVELGLRGKQPAGALSWSAALYRTELADDIQFISSQGAGSNSGYFQNVGVTLRQGLELAWQGTLGRTRLSLRYGYVDATYQSAFVVSSPANSSASGAGNIGVRPGNRIPGIPQHTLKLRLSREAEPGWTLGVSLQASSGVYARGDENNQDANGQTPGYAVVHLDTRYRLADGMELFARVNNLFDRRYANFAALGRNVFTGAGDTFNGLSPRNEPFLGYGAPLGAWVGLRWRW